MRLLAGLFLLVLDGPCLADESKIDFWAAPRKGANMMNLAQTEAQFAAAAFYLTLTADLLKP